MFEADAHRALGSGVFFEPAMQSRVGGNAFQSPYTANRTRDATCVGATLIVPMGTVLGLLPG